MVQEGLESVEIAFASAAVKRGDLRLLGVRGREEMSRLFAFDLFLSRESGPLADDEIDALFGSPCAIALGPEPTDVVRGVIERIRQVDASRSVAARYVARLVPGAWLLTLARTNRIYQDLTVPEIAASLLTLYGMRPEIHYRILVEGKSPKREYVVQYEESDWDFLQRWLEHEGLYYWFEHGGRSELLVISDSSANAPPIAEPKAVSYREKNNLSTGREATIWELEFEQKRVPARVAVFDYNHRTPHVRLAAKAVVDDKTGFGTVMRYGDHFKNVDEGALLAKLRAEQIACGRRTFTGRTDASRFRVGHHFTLQDHHQSSLDGGYLITAMDHKVGEPVPGVADHEGPGRYVARFEAIPVGVQYRPAALTPWPSIHGIMHGHVEADGTGIYAEIDEHGRYKVRLPFDSGNAAGAAVSRWIRMAQPYSGPGYGSHQPLHRGTEVLIAYVDGDPDRPVIIGSVPNAHTVSPVTRTNATQAVTQTAAGIRIEMEDLADYESRFRGGRS